MSELEWESVYVERITCCGRVVRAGFELPGKRKDPGPAYGNTTFERHYRPGKMEGRWMCHGCPAERHGMTVFPETCDRAEATS